MAESFPPTRPVAPSAAPLTERHIPLWLAFFFALSSAALTAWATQAWLLRESPQGLAAHELQANDLSPIELAPTAAGGASVHAPAMLYGMLPLHSGHGLRDEQCRQLAVDAMKESGVTEIDPGGESVLFARHGDYALFVGCHLDQKLILVGAAGPVPEQAESLQAQLLRSLQTRF